MDLSKLSDADLEALHSGDLSKVSDEGLEHLHSDQDSAPAEPSLQGGSVRSLMDLINPGFSSGVGHGAIEKASLGNVKAAQPSDSEEGLLAGKAAGIAGIGAVGGGPVAAAETGLGRIGASAASSGLQGFLQKPAGDDGLTPRAKNAAVSAGLGGLLQAGGEGVNKVGDWLMQKAVGMRKYMPGVGEKLADEGLIGTKGMMSRQAASALPEREAELQAGVQKLQGQVEPEGIADAIRAKAAPYSPAPGASGPMPAPSDNARFIDAAHSRADEALARGALSPSEALDVSRAVAKPAYSAKSGEPFDAFRSKLSQTEGGSLKDAIKSMADEQNVPEVRDALGQEAALLGAKRGLDKPESLQTVLAKLAIKAGIGGGLGYAADGATGAAAGALMSTPLGQSTAGRGAIGAARATPYVTPALINALSEAQRSGGAK